MNQEWRKNEFKRLQSLNDEDIVIETEPQYGDIHEMRKAVINLRLKQSIDNLSSASSSQSRIMIILTVVIIILTTVMVLTS